MSKRLNESDLFEIFGRDADIPESVDKRMQKAYDKILRDSGEKSGKPAVRRFKLNKTLVAAAVIGTLIIAFAGTAIASVSNEGFFKSAFGKQGVDTEHYDKEYYYYWKREDVDTEKAGLLLNDYVINIDKTFQIDSNAPKIEKGKYTVHVEKAVIDTNDVGYITYSIEGPNLSKHILMPDKNDTHVLMDDVFQAFYICYDYEGESESEDYFNDSHNLDVERSTDDKYYIVQSFLPIRKNDKANLVFKYGEPNKNHIDIEIPKNTKFPAIKFIDKEGDSAVSVSPIGIADICATLPSTKPSYYRTEYVLSDCDRLIIKYKDGSEYVVKDYIEKDVDGKEKDILNLIVHSYADPGPIIIFNRFVDVTQISEIVIDDEVLTLAE